ncbi:hypothetical protein L211DRAFT_834451 [Terfezia boudieri ATCC MYA-4762]|uniref:Uncharacterized protein n=1 Tax=Terfezia boudieri ATCC MYA-4762 TaxID=1051890 RepID=A0A3N4M0Z3_9PEZI|nr:hypothetical protein L211DRAFT_834451 [Terfezia boudieri ATCC MYA-4762]
MREGESGTEAAGINADLQQFATWHGHLKILALLGATANFMPEVLLPHNFNIEVDHIGCGASYQYPNSKY